MRKDWDVIDLLASLLVSFVVSVVVSFASALHADAYVKVHPAFKSVGFLTAVVSGHGYEWLFYNHPITGFFVIEIALFILLFFVIVSRK